MNLHSLCRLYWPSTTVRCLGANLEVLNVRNLVDPPGSSCSTSIRIALCKNHSNPIKQRLDVVPKAKWRRLDKASSRWMKGPFPAQPRPALPSLISLSAPPSTYSPPNPARLPGAWPRSICFDEPSPRWSAQPQIADAKLGNSDDARGFATTWCSSRTPIQ